jgi:amidase
VTDIALQPAHALAEAIRRRDVSSRELLEHYLSRIGRLNPPLNPVVTLDPDGARRTADAADAALCRGETGGPLHGIPMTIKDSYQTAGMRTTCGYPAWDHVPDNDADAVLPVGVQIVGPYPEDRTTLAVARCIEELLGGFVPPPGV